MSTFDELTISAAEVMFDALSPVTVTYKPSGGAEREIEVIISYTDENPEPRVRGRTPLQTIIVRNSSSTGLTSAEIDTGLDKIEMPIRQGDSAKKDFRMTIINQNAAFLRLECK